MVNFRNISKYIKSLLFGIIFYVIIAFFVFLLAWLFDGIHLSSFNMNYGGALSVLFLIEFVKYFIQFILFLITYKEHKTTKNKNVREVW